MLRLYVEAPFAAFRTFSAGRYRPTAPFMTPSAAYGLVLNCAAIDSRLDTGSAATGTQTNLPAVRLALGVVGDMPVRQSLYQQLHNYPVGQAGKDRAIYGQKYNIQPIRRDLLSGLRAIIAMDTSSWLEERVRQGLRQGARYSPEGKPRYGLAHAGDNNLLLSRLEEDHLVSCLRDSV
jgi:CRISPR-associated protein Cas5t